MAVETQAVSKGGVILLRAQTEMHPGTGAGTGAVDLCIQREVHTQWPVIHASALKGVLRDAYTGTDGNKLFGAVTSDGESGAGLLGLTDAFILAFPVASTRGVFAWVTCEGAVERMRRMLRLSGFTDDALPPPLASGVGSDEAVRSACATDIEMRVGDAAAVTRAVTLRDLSCSVRPEGQESVTRLADWLAQYYPEFVEDTLFDPRRRLVQVSGDAFTYLVRYGTSISSHNALDDATRTVEHGALFSQENLPAETLMYAAVLAAPRNGLADPVGALKTGLSGKFLQVGADETKGKGLCWFSVHRPEE